MIFKNVRQSHEAFPKRRVPDSKRTASTLITSAVSAFEEHTIFAFASDEENTGWRRAAMVATTTTCVLGMACVTTKSSHFHASLHA